jgi:hypothetical protein
LGETSSEELELTYALMEEEVKAAAAAMLSEQDEIKLNFPDMD